LGFIRDDSRGFAFSLDLLLAIIPLTIILGMAAADMDNMYYALENTIFQGSTDRVAVDTVNTLLGTSGDPTDWESAGNPPKVDGIAYYDPLTGTPVKGTISSLKLKALTESDVLDLTGDQYQFYLNVSRTDNNQSIKTLGIYNGSAANIIKVERAALYSDLVVVSKAQGVIIGSGAARPYTNPPNQFATSASSLGSYDYWILMENNGYNYVNITINTATIYLGPNNITTPTKIDPGLLKSDTKPDNNTVSIMTGSSPGTSLNFYIVEVPAGTPPGEITLYNVQPKPCRFQFYLWVTGD
jgi:hypothetical protein